MIYIDNPGIVQWNAIQGQTFYKAWTFLQSGAPVNLTGWTAKLGGKININQIALDIDVTTASGITLGGVAGTTVISVAPAVTRTWPVGRIVIQFEYIEGGIVQPYLVGSIVVAKEIPV